MSQEDIYGITPTGSVQTLKVASNSSVTTEIIQNSRFILMDDKPNSPDYPKLLSLASTFNGLAILVWERCEDGIYRWKADINLTNDYSFRIEKKMKDGSYRRTDVSIVF